MNESKVVILCGGRGSRLKEETELLPKPLIEIGGRPILWHIMKIYSHFGYNDFILCLGYRGYLIKEYFYNYQFMLNDFTINLGGGAPKDIEIHNNKNEENWRVTLVDTGLNVLKGARIKKIEKFIEGSIFLLTYGDGVADIDINEVINFHKSHGRMATLTGVRPPSRFGDLIVDKGKVSKFTEKPQASGGLINGGFFVFDRKFFDLLSTDSDCDFEKGPLELLTQQGELMVYEHKGSWECMDTLRDMEYLNNLWNRAQAFWKIWE